MAQCPGGTVFSEEILNGCVGYTSISC